MLSERSERSTVSLSPDCPKTARRCRAVAQVDYGIACNYAASLRSNRPYIRADSPKLFLKFLVAAVNIPRLPDFCNTVRK